MRSFKNPLYSLLLISAFLLSSVSFASAKPDEGMYTPDQIANLNLKKRGLKISPLEIYNPKGGGLTEAVVRLSVGCSSEFVSPDGLILTNHHCGFDALVQASTPGKDLVETGFRTDSRAGEIPAKGYSVFITEREEDVTLKVRQGTENLKGEALAAALKTNMEALQTAEQGQAPNGSRVVVQMLNDGYFFYLYQTHELKDVRVVYAPPRNIGVFGGDPDNFEWTRHTGDFTFLRAYVAPDGTSAEYSLNNVPYKPKKFLTMSIAGLKDNDFVFVLGYPGRTTRYRESQSVQYAEEVNFPFLASWLQTRADALRMIGETNEEKRIELQSDIANFDNSRKVFFGGAERLEFSDAVAKRKAEEARFTTWLNEKPERKAKYGTVLSDLAAVSAKSNTVASRDVLIRRIPDTTMPIFSAIFGAAVAAEQDKMIKTDAERTELVEKIKESLEGREPIYEREMIKYFLHQFDELPAGQKFETVENLFGKFKGKERQAEEAKFAESIAEGDYWTPETIAALYGPRTMDFRPERDNPYALAVGILKAKIEANERAAQFGERIGDLRLLYQQGMAEMKGITPYPDANSTLRFSFGNITGYSPREAEFRTPFTTMKGMLEKDTGKIPFDMPQKLKDLQAAKDFGRFGQGDSVVVDFLSNNDIIGGNSGSPVFNGKGEQVGICFDGNYEGLGNDLYFDPHYNRTISVDIRFVLFVTEKFGNAGWILDEMKIVGK